MDASTSAAAASQRQAATPALPAAAVELRERVEAALGAHLDRTATRLATLDPTLAPVHEELRAFVASGKRLRPVLLLLGYRAGGGRDPDAVMGPAIGLELLHTCALIHDDLIDDADVRRGRAAVHVAFASRYAAAGRDGDAGRFGSAAALLVGDLSLAQADGAFLDARVPPERLTAALREFGTLREELMAGQYLDVDAASRGAVPADVALRIASLKSGRYSVALPLRIGAVLAGADPAVSDGLAAAGVPLGQAFQLRDDVLGVFGHSAETGKPADSDLIEDKRTTLVALTRERLGGDELARFDGLLGRPDLGGGDAEWLRAAMVESGGRAAVEALAERLLDEGCARLGALGLERQVSDDLIELARFLVTRRA